jgi:hypothetical protein
MTDDKCTMILPAVEQLVAALKHYERATAHA